MSKTPNISHHFEELYLLHYAKMLRFAKQYLLVAEDAENVVQDVYSDLWEHWHELSSHPNHLAYLLYVTRNRCIDHLRRKTVRQNIHQKLVDQQKELLKLNLQALEQFDALYKTENDIDLVIQKALSCLPPKCREIFYKNKLEGKKHKEIAFELNISINTVESQMAIAYRKLREALKDILPLLAIFL